MFLEQGKKVQNVLLKPTLRFLILKELHKQIVIKSS